MNYDLSLSTQWLHGAVTAWHQKLLPGPLLFLQHFSTPGWLPSAAPGYSSTARAEFLSWIIFRDLGSADVEDLGEDRSEDLGLPCFISSLHATKSLVDSVLSKTVGLVKTNELVEFKFINALRGGGPAHSGGGGRPPRPPPLATPLLVPSYQITRMSEPNTSGSFRAPFPKRGRTSEMMGSPVSEDHRFETPTKKLIEHGSDLSLWLASSAYQEYLGFLKAMNTVCRGKVCKVPEDPSPYPHNEVGTALLSLLDKLNQWIDEIPPEEILLGRFGNKAFKTWYARFEKESPDLIQGILPSTLHQAAQELGPYLLDSFGNATRIDYGTGHEMAFVMFLYCLFRVGALQTEHQLHTILTVFPRYLEVCRRLQVTYRFEPAGSRGVWALDDFQFVPFIWGSSQMVGQGRISPDQFPDPEVASRGARENMFLSCIHFIHQGKSGPFSEHSNQLWNISGAQSWTKINEGMIKMYKDEVMGKWPVIQHVFFGTLLTLEPAKK
ncbi:unnamed protein product [Cyprideis torosa]|uniref:Serine/threonine-protein phosphatase 2A activator n=1 Tax=Cyprideis torosa TaxID=163714 RepID=A0A7R8W764_9CRUS|nr:unnamed protein product [Cyprideis torosa]CAG0882448.1 unnamed protein product [Cyprideis torosa]